MLVTMLLSHAGDGAAESVLTIAHQGAAADHQGVAAGRQGATVDYQGAATDHQGIVAGHQGATIDRQVDRQGAAKQQRQCHRLSP
jgi:hypothetical protein